MTEKIRLFERIESGRTAVRAGRIPGLRERRKTLKRLLILLVSHREAAYSVLADDLGRSRQAAIWSEMLPLIQTLKYLIRKLPSLASPRRLPVNWVNFPAREKIFPEPLGHVLIAASWDFPILLALEPVIGAYAAGNRVVVKLSGRAEKSVQFVRWLIEETFVGDEVVSVDNEASLEELLAYGFDFVHYAGDESGARDLHTRMAGTLTPVSLRTGGKSPAIVDCRSRVRYAAERIVQAKFFNAGQSRIAPDFVFVHERIAARFKQHASAFVRKTYGREPLENPEYGKIIDAAHYERLSKLFSAGRLVCGGEKDPEHLKIAPTIVDMISKEELLKSGEICGPVLPVVTYLSEEDLVKKLKRFSCPPALYCFSGDAALVRHLIRCIPAGNVVINDAGMQFFNHRMPARKVFAAFSHYKTVMTQVPLFIPPWRKLPLRGLWNTLLECLVKWSV
ncbi:MAG: aldehyde dehydrogenase family protein [Lentisphaeria bacterium]|nr:aldehyde dehydrogenase family protein [Lentisphaeria bacterium]